MSPALVERARHWRSNLAQSSVEPSRQTGSQSEPKPKASTVHTEGRVTSYLFVAPCLMCRMGRVYRSSNGALSSLSVVEQKFVTSSRASAWRDNTYAMCAEMVAYAEMSMLIGPDLIFCFCFDHDLFDVPDHLLGAREIWRRYWDRCSDWRSWVDDVQRSSNVGVRAFVRQSLRPGVRLGRRIVILLALSPPSTRKSGRWIGRW